MNLPFYPNFSPVAPEHRDAVKESLKDALDGVSEFTFANILLFRKRYDYRISFTEDMKIIIHGEREGRKFFMTPCAIEDSLITNRLLLSHDYWKNISESVLERSRPVIESAGAVISEDRDNFDYLYLREDLAKLPGKKFHKKRNLVNAFLLSCPVHSEEVMVEKFIPQALSILDAWMIGKSANADYEASREALELFSYLGLEGKIYFINKQAAGYCLGEPAGKGIFALHFEKAIEEYKGLYQYINQNFAESLDPAYTYINREQDLGDEGLRQAKMTYRPSGFVKKHIAVMHD